MLDLHEHFLNSLDPELGQNTQVLSSHGTMPRHEEDDSRSTDRSQLSQHIKVIAKLLKRATSHKPAVMTCCSKRIKDFF